MRLKDGCWSHVKPCLSLACLRSSMAPGCWLQACESHTSNTVLPLWNQSYGYILSVCHHEFENPALIWLYWQSIGFCWICSSSNIHPRIQCDVLHLCFFLRNGGWGGTIYSVTTSPILIYWSNVVVQVGTCLSRQVSFNFKSNALAAQLLDYYYSLDCCMVSKFKQNISFSQSTYPLVLLWQLYCWPLSIKKCLECIHIWCNYFEDRVWGLWGWHPDFWPEERGKLRSYQW